MRTDGFPVRILIGLEVRGMKKSRVRKTKNDTIDAESIARYLMIRDEKETFVIPENFMNLMEFITAYSIVTGKIRTTKNNLIRALDMIFPGLSNAIDIYADTVDILSKYMIPEDFISADPAEIEKYVSKKRYDKIMKIASDSSVNLFLERSLRMEISSLIRILKVIMCQTTDITYLLSQDHHTETKASERCQQRGISKEVDIMGIQITYACYNKSDKNHKQGYCWYI